MQHFFNDPLKNPPIQTTGLTTLRAEEGVAVGVAEEVGHVGVKTEAGTTGNVSTMTGTA